jgi:hypothetical protein
MYLYIRYMIFYDYSGQPLSDTYALASAVELEPVDLVLARQVVARSDGGAKYFEM